MNTKAFYSVLTIAFCAFTFILTAQIILSMDLPLGSDAYFHLGLSRYIGQGNFTAAWGMMMGVNSYPYPVLYHVLISPIAASGDPYTGLRILEMTFLPVTFALVAWLMWKVSGPKAALISGLVLLGSWSFLDGAIQARPESLDLLFYPLIIYAALYTRKKWFAALSIATIYNHGFAALSNIFGVAVNRLKIKNWRKTILIATAIALPIIIISLAYFGGAWKMWATTSPTENPQETLFWTYPPWIAYYAGITMMGFAFVAVNTMQHFKHQSLTELEKLLTAGFYGNLLMLPFWADRWLQYSSLPLAMLTGIAVSRWHGKRLYIALAVITIGAWIYISNFILISAFHGWWQPGRFIGWGLD